MDYGAIIANYLAIARSGRDDEAFHGLIDFTADIVPSLVQGFHKNSGTEVQRFLLDVIIEYRNPASLEFVTSLLFSSDSRLCSMGLDGLVKISTTEARSVVQSAIQHHPRRQDSTFSRELQQAMDDIEWMLARNGNEEVRS